jgi:putative transposase
MLIYIEKSKQATRLNLCYRKKRDKEKAFCFFQKAIGQHGLPEKVTMDKSGANKVGIDKVNLLLTLLFLFTGIFY